MGFLGYHGTIVPALRVTPRRDVVQPTAVDRRCSRPRASASPLAKTESARHRARLRSGEAVSTAVLHRS